MTRCWAIVIVALLLVCIVGIAIYSSGPDELSYHGKSLSRWLDQLDDHAAGGFVSWGELSPKTPQQIEAAEAIRALGTNAMPRLMRDLTANDTPAYTRWQQAQQYFREKILRRPRVYGMERVTPAQKIRWKAALALDALGPVAQSAIPRLVTLTKIQSSDSSCKEASFILAGMGSAGIAALTNYAPSPNSWQHICAVWAIGRHPPSSTNLVPWLLAMATNRPPGSAGGYPAEMWALGQIHANATRVIPWLLEEMSNTNGAVPHYQQSAAAEALGHYGKEASNAVPALKAMQTDPQLKWVAGEALKKIIP